MAGDELRSLAVDPDDAAALPADVVRIRLPTPFPVGRVNCYLIEGDPLTLVDTGVGTARSLDALERSLARLGRRLEDLELLVLTHEHLDHLGLAELIAARSGCEVAAHASIAHSFATPELAKEVQQARIAWATGQLQLHGYPRELAVGARAVLQLAQAMGSAPTVTRRLEDGDEIVAGGRTLLVRHRPGHSPSDLLLEDVDAGLVLAGDHLLTGTSSNPTLAADPAVVVPTKQAPRMRSLPAYIESLAATKAEGDRLMLPGHGPAFETVQAIVDARLEGHERRVADIRGLLTVEPQTAFELAGRLWRGVPVVQPHLTHSEALGHLDVLVDRGQASEVVLDGGTIAYVTA